MDTTILNTVGPKQEPVGNTGAIRFSMRNVPQLSQGTTFDAVATAENLWLSLKVYASGGENSFHHHTVEDHAFVVLQGKATFYFNDGSEFVADQYEGVMLPKGTFYRFQADEAQNLVMLRIGAAQRKTTGIEKLQKHGSPVELLGTTFDDDGTVKVSRHGISKKPNEPAKKIPGKFFPKD
jgi:mannose-6-phosphate isomerase-like protein (cupin superfamily)